jgi:hypothetical protein
MSPAAGAFSTERDQVPWHGRRSGVIGAWLRTITGDVRDVNRTDQQSAETDPSDHLTGQDTAVREIVGVDSARTKRSLGEPGSFA